MMAANGYLTASALLTVQSGIRLSVNTAIAWQQLVPAARSGLKRNISIAPPAGGYRSFAVQKTMQSVSKTGTTAEKRFWGLSTTSKAALADPGNSNHGLGVCVDVVGTPIDAAFIALAKKYGFTRPLPTDPNHFQHDGKTAIHEVVTGSKKFYVVKSGDMLGHIASKYSTSVAHLLKLNPAISNANLIRVGQKIRVS